MTEPRWFPIQGGPKILWGVIEPHERQAQANHEQTLERLAQRGGLSPCEAVAVLEDRDWHKMPAPAALARLHELNAASEYQRGFKDGQAAGADVREALRQIATALRERTWLSPVTAEEMNRRDAWLAQQIEDAAGAATD